MTVYGYARVSTSQQELETQREKLKAFGAEVIYTEKYTGTKVSGRIKLNELMDTLKIGDVVAVTKIDRLARSIMDLKQLISEINDKGATITFIDNGITYSSQKTDCQQELLFNVLGAFAQFERDLIVSRTQEGRRYAKENNVNYKEGRPKKIDDGNIDMIMKLLETHSVKQVADLQGVSTRTIYRIVSKYKSNQLVKNE